MICKPCKKFQHDDCPGDTWCDCQHQPPGAAGNIAIREEADTK